MLYLQGLRPKEDYESAIKQVLEMKPAPADSTMQKQQRTPGSDNVANDGRKNEKAK
jgi:hypothetical protein